MMRALNDRGISNARATPYESCINIGDFEGTARIIYAAIGS
jgi:hypothetical protein